MSFPSRPEYEKLLYGLVDAHPNQIAVSTLRLFSVSALAAIIQGEVQFYNGLSLRVFEIVDFGLGRLVQYSYTVFAGIRRVRWNDPQPHAEIPALAHTFPHHLHDHPDIKHNRQPAPRISFAQPNIEALVDDCRELGERLPEILELMGDVD